jgi:hypothetical protein
MQGLHRVLLAAALLLALVPSSHQFAPLQSASMVARAARRAPALHLVSRVTPLQQPQHASLPATRAALVTRSAARKTTALPSLPLVSGALAAGALHAICGPDHLAALLPSCISLPSSAAGRIGVIWGLGHGVSVTILGAIGYMLSRSLKKASNFMGFMAVAEKYTNVAVGISMIAIGVLGIRESNHYVHGEGDDGAGDDGAGVMGAKGADGVVKRRSVAVFLNGLLHGFSLDGIPYLTPSLAVPTISLNLLFLLAYSAGTMAAMGVATSLIGEITRRLGRGKEDLPKVLGRASSGVAVVVGAVWTVLALR